MKKASRNLRRRLRCIMVGHAYYRLIWPGFERDWRVPRVYKCRVCGSVDVRTR